MPSASMVVTSVAEKLDGAGTINGLGKLVFGLKSLSTSSPTGKSYISDDVSRSVRFTVKSGCISSCTTSNSLFTNPYLSNDNVRLSPATNCNPITLVVHCTTSS